MASLFSHPVVPLALGLTGLKTNKKLMLLCVLLTLLPDADVVAFKLGVPYASPWGHRGFTHSLSFSLFVGGLCALFYRRLKVSWSVAFSWTTLSILSHALLDALTNGGLGVALLWPFSHERYFFPFRPVQVSPIGLSSFLSWEGVAVIISEILWVWIPLTILTVVIRYCRQRRKAP